MISGYTMHGYANEVFKLFEEMRHSGIRSDHITLVGVLSTCIQEGLVNKGLEYFHSMSQDYGIIPRVEHYACMVDLLGHVGCMDEAKNLNKKCHLNVAQWCDGPCLWLAESVAIWRWENVAMEMKKLQHMGKHCCVAENIMEMELSLKEDPTTYGMRSFI
jgi:pentatricopeptide repeat protein